MSDLLSSDIQYIKGVGPKLAKILSKKGIETVEDALYFVPRAYEDRRAITPIRNLRPGVIATIHGKVTASRLVRAGRKKRLEVTLTDKSGSLILSWFHAYPSLLEDFVEGAEFVVCGEVRLFRNVPQITHPEYEKVSHSVSGKPLASINFGRIVPVYSETEGLHQKTIRRVMGEVIKISLGEIEEPLPEELRERLELPSLRQSFLSLHFPKTLENQEPPKEALRRIIFEEFFILQLGIQLRKIQRRKEKASALIDSSGALDAFFSKLPFKLTGDQLKAIESIRIDLAKNEQMVRLVQGDVGSGKTVVAFASVIITQSAGFQSALMAPTELLAQQHAANAEKLLSPLGIRVGLLTHSTAKDKALLKSISTGEIHLVVGTHALFQESVEFAKLGLVIVDEQHRFGVEQRNLLLKKAQQNPHLLMMTATPIPRSLALTLYGDLSLTVIRQKPPGRTPIKTLVIRDRDRPRVYQKVRERLEKGEQVYIIYPLVEASEKLELKSATDMYEKLSKEVFPGVQMKLLHGRMKADEKDTILKEFKAQKSQILVSTTVIEVGIDVPNATLMVIEHPERLGLSQLHQLRGRVGRGSLFSECILVAEGFVTERLQIMTKSDDGFIIAEEDLRIRGPGEFLGTRQSGLPGFRVGNILRDADLLEKAKEEAERILEVDPNLSKPENEKIKQMLESRWKTKLERLRSG